MNLRKQAVFSLALFKILFLSSNSLACELTVTIYNVPYKDICSQPGFNGCRAIRISRLDKDFLSLFEIKGYHKKFYCVEDGVLSTSGTKIGEVASRYHYQKASGRIGFVIIDIPPPGGEDIKLKRTSTEDTTPHFTISASPVNRLATYYDLRKLASEVSPKFTLQVNFRYWDFEIR